MTCLEERLLRFIFKRLRHTRAIIRYFGAVSWRKQDETEDPESLKCSTRHHRVSRFHGDLLSSVRGMPRG